MVIIQKVEGWDTNVVKDIVDKLAEKAARALVFLRMSWNPENRLYLQSQKCGRTCWKLGETCSGSYAR